MPPLLLTLVILGALTASEKSDRVPQPAATRFTWGAFAVPIGAAAGAFACLLAVSDFRLAAFQRHPGMAEYNSILNLPIPVAAEDMYGSRLLASACGKDASVSQYDCWRTAIRAAARATRTADDTANAWYNLAQFTAAQNDVAGTSMALSHAIEANPKWFKPHWAMAELASRTGDRGKARREEEIAESLTAKRDPELTASLLNLKARLN
jgi:hypothetical protein